MSLPNTYTDKNETGCCAVPNINEWDEKEMTSENQHFIRMYTKSFFFMPLNMAKIMKQLNETAEKANATLPPEQVMILSRDLSPWRAEQLYGVSRPIEGADNVVLDGTFISQVFEGPYKDAGKWHKAAQNYVKELGREIKKFYFFYTTCPKCAKHYGKNYVIGLAEV
ncbi:hypothetical protein A3F37_00495 [Candidatus Saccharibacteria bacterium RIFCSPHIGHO2_12_FULL_41_12]|nr:MAG: hypothetical protein A3F37_00495 [Candidatus Saccharibacteria bacterium RIFCSPHIGHO2_12_FULL_41_12]